ncbi:maltose/maltodextrinABC transporter substrate-binding protein MalE [Klebsiella pneumoniae]|nr:maltose/maltodextrinABC transporter substrate-binding protein MalE [Klebsiella pneumoniae]
MPGIPEMGEVWGPANAALELSLTGKQAPQAALDNAVKQITMQIRSDAGQQSVIHRHVKSPSGRGTSRL